MGFLDATLKSLGINSPEESTKPVDSVEAQSQEDKDLVAFVRDKATDWRTQNSRVASEGVWMTNIAALMGYSNVNFNTQTRQWNANTNNFAAPTRKGGSGLIVNKLLPRAQNRLARLCKSPPKYDVRPDSATPEDKEAARFNAQVLESMIEKHRVNQKRIELYQWAQQCGHAYVKVSFDPSKGEFLTDPVTGETINEGDVRIDVKSAFQVIPDPLAKDLDDCSGLLEATVRKLDYFPMQYGDKGKLVKEEAAWLLSAQYEQRINTMNASTQNGLGSTTALMKNAALELCYYERPSLKFPEGRLIITASGVMLYSGPLPLGKIPFIKFDDIKVAGKFYSEAVLTHARPLQVKINNIFQIRDKWTRTLATGKYIAAKGHGLQAEAINNQSGEVVEYNPVPNAGPPQAMSIPMIPNYLYTEEERAESALDDIFGINETSRGVQSSANMPALSMQILQESDETRLGVQTEDNEHKWAQVYQLMLKCGQKFFKSPRKLKINNKGSLKVQDYSGEDIKGDLDVTVVRGSTLPGNKALKRQEVLNTYQLGLMGPIGDPETIQKLLEAMEFGDTQNAWVDNALDQDQINKAIKSIEVDGIILPVDEFDNHKLSIKEIERFRKSDKFTALDVMKQQMILQLREIHLQAMMKLAGAPTDEQIAEQATGPEMMPIDPNQPPQVQPMAGDEVPAEMGVS